MVGKFRQLRFGAVIAAGAAAIVLIPGCAALVGEPEPETVLIAADLELTGEGAELGNIYHNALQLRVEQINQQGLLSGRRLELVVTDNRSDSGTAARNVAELAQDPQVVAIVSGGCSVCAVASAEVVDEHQVPLISLAAADQVSEPVGERQYVFKLAPNAGHNAALIAAQLNAAQLTTIAVVVGGDPYGEDGLREMSEAAGRAGLEVAVTARLTNEPESVSEAVDQISAYRAASPTPNPPFPEEPLEPVEPVGESGLDAVVLWAPAGQSGALATGLRAAGYDGPLYLDSIAADDLFLSGPVGAAYDGATLIFNESLVIDTVIATSPAKAARKTWFNTYSARYGTYHAFSSFAVDAIQLLVETINRLDTLDRDAIRGGFERTQLDGVSGPLRITPTNHSGLTSLGLIPLVARGDRWHAAG